MRKPVSRSTLRRGDPKTRWLPTPADPGHKCFAPAWPAIRWRLTKAPAPAPVCTASSDGGSLACLAIITPRRSSIWISYGRRRRWRDCSRSAPPAILQKPRCPSSVSALAKIETGNAEQLLDQPVHPCDLFSERRKLTIALERVEARGDNGQRRSQFMCGIGGE